MHHRRLWNVLLQFFQIEFTDEHHPHNHRAGAAQDTHMAVCVGRRFGDGVHESEVVLGEKVAVGVIVFDRKAGFFTDVLHGVVIGQDKGRDTFQFFRPANLDQLLQQVRAQPLALPAVAHQQGKLTAFLCSTTRAISRS